jgi:hypothetical protein
MTLTFMENKSNANYKEMDAIARQFERWAKIQKFLESNKRISIRILRTEMLRQKRKS